MPMETVPIQMTVRWRVPPREAQSITVALQGLMQQTRAAPGCDGCSFSTEMGPLVVIRYVEVWQKEVDLQRQICSERFATLAELMERATEHPQAEFAVSGRVHGLEYAEAVRRAYLG
jgi:quinol monooxygenase YgiN